MSAANRDHQAGATSADQAPSAASLEWGFPNRATPAGSSAYYAVRMSAAPHRNALAALFALRAELQAIPDQVSDPGIARIKLDWWRTEIDRLFAGEPRHPLSERLAPVVAQHRLPRPAFIDLIEGVDRVLRAHRQPDQEAQRQSDEQDLGALFELIARCEGADTADQEQLTTARRAGGWCAQVRRIRDAGLLLRHGREVLPADQLAAAELSHEQLASADGRQRLPELLRPIAEQLRAAAPDQAGRERDPEQTQAGQAAASPQRSRRFGDFLTPRTNPTLAGLTPAIRVQLRLHQDLLNVLQRSNFDVADHRIGLTPLRKFWLAWRATAHGSASSETAR
ncbi:squalene/phytoene synthase family protein [Lamprobacter modestohalophilus]|uniref:squalene/phytoene synthase family protein n=1 Tax=Lamprobacter modestohalophilus TaxID=1064514 RepID=UPI002ADEB72B|nr:squalene/phytoene synthase family protein [Lamprobacter modestohalophilus]MEA1053071.1 squalene/phytoene synthase family protein [Lamprobacter modestohalophilus]